MKNSRLLILTLAAISAAAQQTAPAGEQTAPPAQTAQKPEEKPADKPADPAQAAPAKADDKAASPAPSSEPWITGSFDVGYRWVSNIGGSVPTYRSIVNLGDGPKLNSLEFTILDPKARWFDRIDARANSWGGEPYNTAHLDAFKRGLWTLSADYRNIAYFNAMPSFANPFAPQGFNEQAFDTRRRTGYVNLQLFPGKHIMPYLAFERNSGYGHGVTTWVQEANDEFAVPTLLRDSTNNYRAGVRLEFNRYHVTLEQGGTTFKEDDQSSANGVNFGDRTTPILGSTEVLNTLQQVYGIRGTSLYSKILATATPTSWVTLTGQFLWSQPNTDARYFDSATGNFALVSALLLYGGQFNLATSNANAPHVLANAAGEIRPWRRLRIINSWTTNRYHQAGFAALAEQILVTPTSGPAILQALNTRQVVNDNREQIEAIVDVTNKVALRGGYRYEWGDATVRAGVLDPAGPLRFGELRRNVALAGATVRASQKLSMNAEYEGASTGSAYFRTSPYNYNRLRARARYQATGSLYLQANFGLLDNQNPTPGIQYDFRARDNSLSVFWTPNNGKRVTVMAEYDRSTLRSRIDFLLLPFLTPAISEYRENGHTAISALEVNLPAIGGVAAKLTAGGSLFVSTGSRPTQYYQPLGRLSVPIEKHVQWNTEWRWYGFGETFYQYEAFRAHTLMTGIRVVK
jgi:hypothetical protein